MEINYIISELDSCKGAYDLDGVEPTFHPIGDLANVVRDDVPVTGLPLADALANAASTHDRAFRVPAILGGGGGA